MAQSDCLRLLDHGAVLVSNFERDANMRFGGSSMADTDDWACETLALSYNKTQNSHLPLLILPFTITNTHNQPGLGTFTESCSDTLVLQKLVIACSNTWCCWWSCHGSERHPWWQQCQKRTSPSAASRFHEQRVACTPEVPCDG